MLSIEQHRDRGASGRPGLHDEVHFAATNGTTISPLIAAAIRAFMSRVSKPTGAAH
jgi:hypothetical protein